MRKLRKFVKRLVPKAILEPIQRIRRRREHQRLAGRTPQSIFTQIYDTDEWGGAESKSGPGSDMAQTKNVRLELPLLVRELGSSSLLDAP